jgi:hypothetical protein
MPLNIPLLHNLSVVSSVIAADPNGWTDLLDPVYRLVLSFIR